MNSKLQTLVSASVLIVICLLSCYTHAAPAQSEQATNVDNSHTEQQHHQSKRSPFLRLDELNSKLYLQKNKLGGGMIDPFEIGKRSSSVHESEVVDADLNLAVALYDGLANCIARERCAGALKVLMNN